MIEWMPLFVALVGVGGTLAAGVIPSSRQRRHDAERYERERSELDRAERRAAYLELFAQAERLGAYFVGSAHTGDVKPVPKAEVDDYLRARVVAEFTAPPGVWRRMNPWIEGTTLYTNLLIALSRDLGELVDDIAERLRQIGATTTEDLDVLRSAFLAAVADDLAR